MSNSEVIEHQDPVRAFEQPEQPELRPFGSSSNNQRRFKSVNVINSVFVISAIAMLSVGVYAAYPIVAKHSAPPISLSQPVEPDSHPVLITEIEITPVMSASTVDSAQMPRQDAVAVAADSIALTAQAIEKHVVPDGPGNFDEINSLKLQVVQTAAELRGLKVLVESLINAPKAVASNNAPKAAVSSAKSKSNSVASGNDPDAYIALTILEISPTFAVVRDSEKQYKVAPGSQLPGGAIFIGYDMASKVMKTDRGDFMVR